MPVITFVCMMRFVLLAFLAYLLFNVIFYFIIPIYKTTKRVKKGFREMQNRMNEQMKQEQTDFNHANTSPKTSSKKQPIGDYIDFEEIK